jgi:hypothetical protein
MCRRTGADGINSTPFHRPAHNLRSLSPLFGLPGREKRYPVVGGPKVPRMGESRVSARVGR